VTLTDYAIDNPKGFLALVKDLRKAGVVKLGALVLGPAPREPSAAKDEADPDAVARRKHEVMFAASRIRPPFVAPQRSEAGFPRAIVQRQARDEAANGTPKPQR
jgi:hypothetical protein